MNLCSTPSTDPAVILRFRDRQYAAELLAAAILEFDLFGHLDRCGGQKFDDLCLHFQWQHRPADVLMTLCRASGLVEVRDDDLVRVTKMAAEHLVSSSDNCLTAYFRPIADSPIVSDFVSILRTGKPANWQAKSDGADWHQSMRDPKFAKDFTDLMNCRGITFGQSLADSVAGLINASGHMLDVGGGSGIYSSTMVAKHPSLTATVLEQSPVDQITSEQIANAGMAAKIDVVCGEMFEDPWPNQSPEGRLTDTVLLSNLLHDWDTADATRLVRKAGNLLQIGGRLLIHGAIIDADKSGPLPVAEYSCLLMNITQGKCYSVGEYTRMMKQAGFEVGPHQLTTGDRSYIVGIKQ